MDWMNQDGAQHTTKIHKKSSCKQIVDILAGELWSNVSSLFFQRVLFH